MKIKSLVFAGLGVFFLLSACFAGGAWLERQYGWTDRMLQRSALLWRRPPVDAVIPEAELGHLAIYAFLGQSNAAGVAENADSEVPAEQPQVFAFGNDYRWRRNIDPLDDPRAQVDLVSIDRQYGYSAAAAFAKRLRQLRPGQPIGLLSCARGGSSIAMWQASRSDSSLFGACYKRILAASAAGRLAGIVFLQGERDAVNPQRSLAKAVHPAEWAQRFTLLAATLRTMFGNQQLPIVIGKLGKSPTDADRFSGWATVKEQQGRVALPCYTAVETDAVEKVPDGLHYSIRGYDQLGSMLAEALDQIEKTECSANRAPPGD